MTWLFPLRLRLGNHLRETGAVRRRELTAGHLEQGCDGTRRRAVEESLYDVPQRGAAQLRPRRRRLVDIAKPVLLVREMPLVLEEVEHRPHRGVARRVRQMVADVADQRAAEPIDDIHDLSLPATESRTW